MDQSEWLIGGDFNEIRKLDEHKGRAMFDQLGARDFDEVVSGLIELDVVGGKYMWRNGLGADRT